MTSAEWVLDGGPIETAADLRGRLCVREGASEFWIGRFSDAIFLAPTLHAAIGSLERAASSPLTPSTRFEIVGEAPLFLRLRKDCTAELEHLGRRFVLMSAELLLSEFAKASHDALARFEGAEIATLAQRYFALRDARCRSPGTKQRR